MRKSPLTRAVDSLNEVFVQMVWVVMKAMPFFVFALMAGQIVKAAGTEPEMLKQLLSFLLRYGLVVVLGLAIMVFLFYPALVALTIKEIDLETISVGHA